MWLLGFLSGGSSFYQGGNYSFNDSDFEKLKDWKNLPSSDNVAQASVKSAERVLGDSVSSAMSSTAFWIVFSFLIVLLIIFVYLHFTARGAIIKSAEQLDVGKSLGLKNAWGYGRQYFWRVFIFSLVMAGIILLGLLIAATPIVLLAIFEQSLAAIIFGIIFFLAFLVYLIYLSLVSTYAERILILEDKGAIESIKLGIKFFNKSWKNIAVVYLIVMAISLIATMAVIIAIIAPILLLIGIGALFYLISSSLTFIYATIAILALVVLFCTLMGMLNAYISTVYTLTYKELKSSNQSF